MENNLINSRNIDNVKLVYGGKANSLIRLVEIGLPVPEFFVVPASYFYNYVNHNSLEDVITNLIKNKEYSKAKDIILNATFPTDMANEIFSMVDGLDLSEMSVRSSASNEDGESKSFAGQYNTYLNVSKDDLLSSIVNCWASILDDNVVSYIGDDTLDIYSVNVVVQKMINPDFAGVAFSMNPTSRSKNFSLIESCEGVGERLVSGETTPTRYIVRREIGVADIVIGKPMLANNHIKRLEEYLLTIEKEYGFPVDTEWCVLDDNIYILQARPITAFSNEVIMYEKRISRQKKLFELEIYNAGERDGIKAFTGDMYYFKPLFHFVNSEITHIYYDMISLEEFPNSVFRELDNNYDKLHDCYKIIKENCEYLENVMANNIALDVREFVKKLIEIQPYSSLGNLVGQNWKVTDRVKDLLFDYRNNHDTIIYRSTDYLANNLGGIVDPMYHKYLSVLTLGQILGDESIDILELEDRLKGFVYYNGNIYLTDMPQFLKRNGFSIREENESSDIQGGTAFGGVVTAPAKIIFSTNDFDKFNDGDILVTSMTTPKFTSVMKKAGGIITDEGGVTCHAAIVARELKVPCIVGTKNATTLIKDGDIVELNADGGIAKIIE